MNKRKSNCFHAVIVATLCGIAGLVGCAKPPKYGTERQLVIKSTRAQTWAVGPAINLSGEKLDPLLQADLLFSQLQQVRGITGIPVNRVAEVYAALRIEKVQNETQAALVCDLLGCDALLIPTITYYDPYNPPKVGASLQLFGRNGFVRETRVDPRELARRATPAVDESLPPAPGFRQATGLFDAASGSTREQLSEYASGRNDPFGPMKEKEYIVSMDRFSSFVYYRLIADLIGEDLKPPVAATEEKPLLGLSWLR